MFNFFKKFNLFLVMNKLSFLNLNFSKYLFLFNYNLIFSLNFNKFYFFFNNFLLHFSFFSNFKFSKFKNHIIFKQPFRIENGFTKFKFFKLNSNKLYFITRNLNLFNFLNFKNKFFINPLNNNIYNSSLFLVFLNIFFVKFFSYRNIKNTSLFDYFLKSSNFFDVSFLVITKKPQNEEDEDSIFYDINKFNFETMDIDIDTFLCILDENFKLVKSQDNPTYVINKKFIKIVRDDILLNNVFYSYYSNYLFLVKYDRFYKKDTLLYIDKENAYSSHHFFKDEKDILYKAFFSRLFRRYKSIVSLKKLNPSSYTFFYKFVLRELINVNEDFFYKFLFNYNFNFYSFVSISYFNFFSNFNFVNEILLEDKNDQDSLNFPIFNDFKDLNINFTNEIYIFNNQFPILLNQELITILFFNEKSKLNFNNFSKFYKLYVSNFFENVLNKSIFFKIDTNFFKKYNHSIQVEKIINDYRNYNNKFSKFFHITEMIEIIWYSFEFKDLNILSNWLIKMLGFINLKNHKKFLTLLQSLVLDYSTIYTDFLKIKGFFFKIKGKIGLSGNAKKKQIKFRTGKIYLSDKSTKIICEKNVSKTDYGVLGFTMILSY